MRFYHFALALLMASATQASLLPTNFFTNPESPMSDHAHRRASSGRDVGSPFGSGCVGTDPLCAMSLSNADKTERATSRRDIAPELWQVKEDMEWEKNQRAALPGARLESFLTRLGGKDSWQQKLSWSQRELLRRQIEDEARFRAEKLANEKLRQLEHDEEEADRLRSLNWRQRLFATPTYTEAKPLFTVRADRDVPSPRMKMHKLTRKEREARVDWHKGLRDRFTHPLDADAQDFVDRFNPDVLEFEGVKLVSFKKRDGRKRLDK